MDELNKTIPLNLMITPAQSAQLDHAVRIVSLERAEKISRTALARELITSGAEAVVARAAAASTSAA